MTPSSPRLTDPVRIGPFEAPSRVIFGPHETNLAQGRAMSHRHVAYYARRAAGGAGVIVTETASVTESDWPYERCPLASEALPAWRDLVAACRPHRTLLLAGLGHAGGQGSSAYSQDVMWAPSRVADVVSREPPAELEPDGIKEVVAAFAAAARGAVHAGLSGVEIDSGPYSLLRQFASGLTNQRGDLYGADRLLFTREVLAAVRRAVGDGRVIALRLCCDELAPWAGITPEQAAVIVAELAPMVDLVTVVRGGPYSTSAYRPDSHAAAGFNLELCRDMRAATGGTVPVALQGSVVSVAMAEQALAGEACDLVEMTRAQIADASLVALARAGTAEHIRPCILCNQACRVRDNRNPIVSCVGDPSSGRETEEPSRAAGPGGPDVLVVGGGPAGLECARVLAEASCRVRLTDRSDHLGGAAVTASTGPGRETLRLIADWLAAECARLGVDVRLGHESGPDEVRDARAQGWTAVLATGSRSFPDRYPGAGDLPVLDALTLLGSDPARLPAGPVVIDDPTGDQIGVGVAEWLAGAGRTVTLVTADQVAGTLLARTGDLADANVRLQRAGVTRQLRSRIRRVGDAEVEVEDVWTGAAGVLPAGVLVDCGHRLPDDSLYRQLEDPSVRRAGDCVAPRTILEAILEGRRAALSLLTDRTPARLGR